MQWLHEVPDIIHEKNDDSFGLDFTMSELTICNEPKETIVTHFYLSMFKHQNDGLLMLPISDEHMLEQVKTEIAPFFEKVNLFSNKGKVKEIHLQYPKKYICKTSSDAINEIFESNKQVTFPLKQPKIYLLNKEFFSCKNDNDSQLNYLLAFLKNMYVNQDLTFMPNGWVLSEGLKDLQILNFLVCHSNHVYFHVDNENRGVAVIQVQF
ncbi:hypothetical protein [Gracilibacillus alcaliphilus]|uniref:hypothetical protein n=1 Tax=Gracilibacillus alcaliphilus TaxID=1401441 RepID=UPI00195ECC71|nr:hypothetical protein [Gracilibacillus alcaliphilus]MBM7678912.1 hypothetical protein [Gracilibacillus alcaliphilus]